MKRQGLVKVALLAVGLIAATILIVVAVAGSGTQAEPKTAALALTPTATTAPRIATPTVTIKPPTVAPTATPVPNNLPPIEVTNPTEAENAVIRFAAYGFELRRTLDAPLISMPQAVQTLENYGLKYFQDVRQGRPISITAVYGLGTSGEVDTRKPFVPDARQSLPEICKHWIGWCHFKVEVCEKVGQCRYTSEMIERIENRPMWVFTFRDSDADKSGKLVTANSIGGLSIAVDAQTRMVFGPKLSPDNPRSYIAYPPAPATANPYSTDKIKVISPTEKLGTITQDPALGCMGELFNIHVTNEPPLISLQEAVEILDKTYKTNQKLWQGNYEYAGRPIMVRAVYGRVEQWENNQLVQKPQWVLVFHNMPFTGSIQPGDYGPLVYNTTAATIDPQLKALSMGGGCGGPFHGN